MRILALALIIVTFTSWLIPYFDDLYLTVDGKLADDIEKIVKSPFNLELDKLTPNILNEWEAIANNIEESVNLGELEDCKSFLTFILLTKNSSRERVIENLSDCILKNNMSEYKASLLHMIIQRDDVKSFDVLKRIIGIDINIQNFGVLETAILYCSEDIIDRLIAQGVRLNKGYWDAVGYSSYRLITIYCPSKLPDLDSAGLLTLDLYDKVIRFSNRWSQTRLIGKLR